MIAALEAGRNPGADPDVQCALAGSALAADQSIPQAIDLVAHERFRAVCIEHCDDVVRAWRTPFDDAAAVLTTARDRIGDLPLDAADTIMRKGGDIAAVWAAATVAVKTIDVVLGGWAALVEFTRAATIDGRYRVLRLADVGHSAWAAKELEHKKITAWEAVLLDLVPVLPTAREYRDRVATIQAGDVRAQQQAEQDHHDAITGRQRVGSR